MRTWSRLMAVASFLALGCVAPVYPAAGQSAPGGDAPAEPPGYTAADVQFMQGMIPHHAQALEMTALVPARSRSLHLLAERIEVSQRDEIAFMQRWLRDRGEETPDLGAHGHHGGHHMLMPGMLTGEEMTQLAGAKGNAFDRLFLRYMIRHHEGALVMVKDLFATPGAAQASEVYRFASDVNADQRMEIERMQAMLDALPAGPLPTDSPHTDPSPAPHNHLRP